MTSSPKLLGIIEKLNFFFAFSKHKIEFRSSEQDFTRQSGKINFCTYALLGISLLKNSLAIELYNLLAINDLFPISKLAYSQGRYQIQTRLYQAWNNLLVNLVYEVAQAQGLAISCELALKMWRGYFLEAIDGTSLAECRPVLPQT